MVKTYVSESWVAQAMAFDGTDEELMQNFFNRPDARLEVDEDDPKFHVVAAPAQPAEDLPPLLINWQQGDSLVRDSRSNKPYALNEKQLNKLLRPATEPLDFGQALILLKRGFKVARAGWNGKGMWLRYVDPYTDSQYRVIETAEARETLLPYIGMKTADNKFVPWLASQTDMLAEDWMLVE